MTYSIELHADTLFVEHAELEEGDAVTTLLELAANQPRPSTLTLFDEAGTWVVKSTLFEDAYDPDDLRWDSANCIAKHGDGVTCPYCTCRVCGWDGKEHAPDCVPIARGNK